VEKYLGEEILTDLTGTEFEGWGPVEWIASFVDGYGMTEGEYHKQWLIDAVARIAHGAPVVVKRASWGTEHSELRVSIGTSEHYERWVEGRRAAGRDWDAGIAP
jgi:hypothetical protein